MYKTIQLKNQKETFISIGIGSWFQLNRIDINEFVYLKVDHDKALCIDNNTFHWKDCFVKPGKFGGEELQVYLLELIDIRFGEV